jgi:hypothetical protein
LVFLLLTTRQTRHELLPKNAFCAEQATELLTGSLGVGALVLGPNIKVGAL